MSYVFLTYAFSSSSDKCQCESVCKTLRLDVVTVGTSIFEIYIFVRCHVLLLFATYIHANPLLEYKNMRGQVNASFISTARHQTMFVGSITVTPTCDPD